MNIRTIRKLIVRPTVRQVDAHEASAGRYLGFVALLVGAFAWAYTQQVTVWGHAHTALTITAVLLAFLLFRPWHRHLRVDMDTVALTFEWRLLAIFPIVRRTHDLRERILCVSTVGVTERGASADQQIGHGCLMLALPFPVSAIVWLFGSGKKKDEERTLRWESLCLTNPERDRMLAEITQLAAPEVGAEFLAAVRDILPEHVSIDGL